MFTLSHTEEEEPLASGSGMVSRDVEDTTLLERWRDTILDWQRLSTGAQAVTSGVPKQVGALIREKGIPDALRGEVWLLLALSHTTASASTTSPSVSQHSAEAEQRQLYENYRLASTAECSCEVAIQKDLSRTFPAHEYFKQTAGSGQEALHKLCKVNLFEMI